MAVPTVIGLAPATGAPTGGQGLEITGANFRLPTAPAPGVIPVPVAPPSVRVTFGGNAAEVSVLSDSRLFVVTPKRAMPVVGNDTLGTEVVDVVVENIDDSGVLIPGESVTVVGGYTYVRPGVAHQDSGDFVRATMALVDLLRSEVLNNTVINTSTDFDPDTGLPLIQLQSTPQVILTGPTMRFNAFFTYRGRQTISTAVAEEFLKGRRHRVVDLEFEVMGVTNSEVELINLMALFETVVDRNTKIDLLCDPGDPGRGTFPLELHIIKSPEYQRAERFATSDLRLWTATILLKGWPLGALPGVARDAVQAITREVTEEPTLEAPLQIGENLPSTQGAPTRSPPEQDVPSPPSIRVHGKSTRSPPESGAKE